MDKLYYSDVYLMKTMAKAQAVNREPDRLWVSLDQTIFYPGGGGQLPDRGMLGNHPLLEIREKQGTFWHGVDSKAALETGQTVGLSLDWDWRFYNMQQHSGQHLLSCVLDRFSLTTVSVHLGQAYTTVEVEGDWPDEATLDEVEEQANRIIRQALPIHQSWVSMEEAARLPLRKEPGNWEKLRVVEIEKIDYSTCGGTHVQSTSEIGYIKITGVEKIRGRARIQAHIGARADQLYKNLFAVNSSIKQELQVDPENFVSRIQDLKNETKQQKDDMALYREGFILSLVEQLHREQENAAVVHFRRDDLAADDVRDTARRLAQDFGRIALGFCGDRFYLTAPSDHPFDSSRFVRDKGQELGIRGGGPPGFTQGITTPANEDKILQAIIKELS